MAEQMLSLRKTIARWPCLMGMFGFLLLVQIQQAIACEMMIMPRVKAGQHCAMPHSGTMQMAQAKKGCCDFSYAFSPASNQCHTDQGTVITPSLSGKLHPDYQPVFMIISLQDTFHRPQPSPLTYIPDRGSSRPGAQTYLTTQRLRI